jgi:hypothetical protein
MDANKPKPTSGSYPRFELISWDFARVSELFQFHAEQVHGYEWSIKGHNRPWIIQHGAWEPGLRFLDVGAGFSDLPAYLVDRFDVEGWVADDYGASSGEQIWTRWGDPADLPTKFPQVKYVFKVLGNDVLELPTSYFDRVYSVSVLEHIPRHELSAVLAHMALLLKPNGLMLHTIDIPFPRTVHGPQLMHVWACFMRIFIRRLLVQLKAPGHNPYPFSTEGWATLFKDTLHIRGKTRNVSTVQMLLDQDILIEPPSVVYHIYPPRDEPKSYWKACSLVMKLRKLNASNQ